MTRAERRRKQRELEKKNKVYNLSVQDIAQMKIDAVEEATRIGFKTMLVFPLIVLRDKHGFGRKRMNDFVEDVLDQYKMFEEGYFSLEDINKVLEEEVGIKISKE